jgi:hypothetical protein
MSLIFLIGIVIAAMAMLAFALWFAGPMDEVFNWLTDDTNLAKNQKRRRRVGSAVIAR